MSFFTYISTYTYRNVNTYISVILFGKFGRFRLPTLLCTRFSVKITKIRVLKICFFVMLLGGTVRLEPIKLQWRGAKSVQPTFKSAAETVR